MKLKNFLSSICAASIVALSFVGCSDYDNDYTEQQLKFIQGFKDVFGEIDHSNDWNLAEQGSVTVTTAQTSRVKIYAKTFGTYKIVGDYEDVSGTQTLTFDMVEGTTDIMVSDGIATQKAKVGDAVTFSGTRLVFTADGDGLNEAKVTTLPEDAELVDFNGAYIQTVKSTEYGVLPEGKFNYNFVTDNFTYISNGEFTIYPIYMQTNSTHILGIYWKGPNGELLTQQIYDNADVKDILTNEDDAKTRPITIYLPEGTQFGFYLDVWEDMSNDDIDNPEYMHTVYSEESFNKEYDGNAIDGRVYRPNTLWGERTSRNPQIFVYAGTFITDVRDGDGNIIDKDVMYLCFEDWPKDYDFNDLIFVFRGELPTIVDEEAMPWILSCEDLGGTFDLDYNDVVLEVSHVSGQTSATVTPLAAGGTLASYVYYYNGTTDQLLGGTGEIHSFFGETGLKSGNYTPVNVSSTKPEKTAKAIPIRVPTTWSIASKLAKYTDEDSRVLDAHHNNMGGFYIKVVQKGEDKESDKDQKIQNEVLNTSENVPYIICTPKQWKRSNSEDGTTNLVGNYRWPMENVPMFAHEAFGNRTPAYDTQEHSFREWIEEKSNNKWYAYPYYDGSYSNTCAESEPKEEGSGTGTDYKKVPSTLTAEPNELTLNIDANSNVSGTFKIRSKLGLDIEIDNIVINNNTLYISKSSATYKDGWYEWDVTISGNMYITEPIIYELIIRQPSTIYYEEGRIEISVTIPQAGGNGGGGEKPDYGDEITEEVGEGSQENQWSPIIYTISKDIFSKYASDVTLSFYVDVSNLEYGANYSCFAGDMVICKDYYFSWGDNYKSPNPLQIPLTEELFAKAKETGVTFSSGLTISNIYIKGTPVSAKRRISNHR
ncbi:MAG: hypothetical protein J1F40_05995 [Prevotellaceae bacterium]|nr:hypothetical protein [Prevotellaceae bacterium]